MMGPATLSAARLILVVPDSVQIGATGEKIANYYSSASFVSRVV